VAVALHGWRRTHADFAASLGPAAPAGPLACLAPDLPGFGATPPPPEPWGSPEYAAAVAHLVEETAGPSSPQPLVVVGHSLGGRIAVRLAAARPDLVGALVLTGAPLVSRSGRRPSAAFRVARALHRAGVVGDERMEQARQRRGSADYRAAEGVMRQVLVRLVNESYDSALAALRCPVELVWGDDDREAPLETARALAGAIPQARLTVCAGAGHLLPVSAPDELRAAVERALARRS
jgi:pimeloyl-ACP methyl ester carboxylesterase